MKLCRRFANETHMIRTIININLYILSFKRVMKFFLPTRKMLDFHLQTTEVPLSNEPALVFWGSMECGPVFEELSHFLLHLFHALQSMFDGPFQNVNRKFQ